MGEDRDNRGGMKVDLESLGPLKAKSVAVGCRGHRLRRYRASMYNMHTCTDQRPSNRRGGPWVDS